MELVGRHIEVRKIVYLLLDVKRSQLGIRQLVTALEQVVIAMLDDYGLAAYARPDAPGVYLQVNDGHSAVEKKIASLGLRVKRGCSYHGLSLNVTMDLSPFRRINPCGLAGLAMTQLSDLGVVAPIDEVGIILQQRLASLLDYTVIEMLAELPELSVS